MKRLLLFPAVCIPCMSLACAEASGTWRAPVLIVLGVLSVALLIVFGRPAKDKPAEATSAPVEPEDPKNPDEKPERS